MAAAPPGVRRSELGDALRACRGAFIGVFMMSCIINLLYLTGSIFMLEVYDRVLPSRSVPTLVGLVVLAGGLYMAQGVLDLIRGRILGRIGTALDEALNARVFDTVVRLPLIVGGRNEGLQPLRDLDNVRCLSRQHGSGRVLRPALAAALSRDLLRLPRHDRPHRAGRRHHPGRADADHRIHDARAGARGDAAWRRAATISPPRAAATPRCWSRWAWPAGSTSAGTKPTRSISGNQNASDVAGGLGAVAKVMRMMLQSAVLGVGAYLVIHQEATAGIIIAGSILTARALAPVDLAIAHWKSFVAARQSWQRLNRLFEQMPERPAPTLLQNPSSRLSVEGVAVVAPGDQQVIVSGRDLCTGGRQRPRRDRAERIGQVVADPRAGRRLAADPRQGSPRRRGA